MNPRVQSVVPKDDYKLQITFTNGEVGIFDCGHLVDFGVFREFRDVGYFSSAGWLTEPSSGLMARTSVRTRSTRIRRRFRRSTPNKAMHTTAVSGRAVWLTLSPAACDRWSFDRSIRTGDGSMRNRLGRTIVTLCLGLMVLVSQLRADTVTDPRLAFTLTLPAEFAPRPDLVGATPDIVHAFQFGEATDGEIAVLLLVEKLGGVIGRERLQKSMTLSRYVAQNVALQIQRSEARA